jgi:hypothetical protein
MEAGMGRTDDVEATARRWFATWRTQGTTDLVAEVAAMLRVERLRTEARERRRAVRLLWKWEKSGAYGRRSDYINAVSAAIRGSTRTRRGR